MYRPHHQSGNCRWHLNYINSPRAMEYLDGCENFKVVSLRSRLSIPVPLSIHPFKFTCIDIKIYRKMRELPSITIFWSRVRRFAGDFHEWRSDEWNSSADPITCDPKIVIHGNECIILFSTSYLISWAHSTTKKRLSITDFAIVAKEDVFWLSFVTHPKLICGVKRT